MWYILEWPQTSNKVKYFFSVSCHVHMYINLGTFWVMVSSC